MFAFKLKSALKLLERLEGDSQSCAVRIGKPASGIYVYNFDFSISFFSMSLFTLSLSLSCIPVK